MIRLVFAASVFFILAACGPIEPETELVIIDVSNQGASCIDGDTVLVQFGGCMSGCQSLVDGSCMGTVDGDTLTVTSTGTIESLEGGAVCVFSCTLPLAACEVTGALTSVTTISYAGNVGTARECSDRVKAFATWLP